MRSKINRKRANVEYVASEILDRYANLRNDILRTFIRLRDEKQSIPGIHITPRSIVRDGKTKPTGNVENILANGLATHSHVGLALKTERNRQIASAKNFATNPELCIQELINVLRDCGRHGIRTNRSQHGNARDQGIGKPSLILFDSKATTYSRMSDHSRHYMSNEPIDGSSIIGEIPIDGKCITQTQQVKDLFLLGKEENLFTSMYQVAILYLQELNDWLDRKAADVDMTVKSTRHNTGSLLNKPHKAA